MGWRTHSLERERHAYSDSSKAKRPPEGISDLGPLRFAENGNDKRGAGMRGMGSLEIRQISETTQRASDGEDGRSGPRCLFNT